MHLMREPLPHFMEPVALLLREEGFKREEVPVWVGKFGGVRHVFGLLGR
jgi:hypothetical protein